jgi:hypothetical protein
MHEGGFSVIRESDDSVTFRRPDGARLVPAPAPPMWALLDPDPLGPTGRRLREAGIAIDARTCMPGDGQPIDIGWALDVLRTPSNNFDGSPLPCRTASTT